MLADYNKLRQAINESFEKINRAAQGINDEILSQNILNQEKLNQNIFNLVVLGQFKRGKTTFINSLLGAEVLPTAVVPLTSIVTVISYGETLKITVVFKDGSTQDIRLEQLPEYITEAQNPNNIKNVKEVRILYPSPYLKDGVRLIDTPGVGSIYRNNTDETYNYIPKVDAAIFLLSVDPPISQAEVEFLDDIKKYAAKIFFILNKIDYLTPKERTESLEFSKQVLESKVGLANVRIFPLSAKLALEGKLAGDEEKIKSSYLPFFEAALSDFLLQEKGKTILLTAINNAVQQGKQLLALIGLEKKALGLTVQELSEKIEEFNRQMEVIAQEQTDAGYILKGEMGKLVESLDKNLADFRETQVTRLYNVMRQYIQNNSGLSNRELKEAVDKHLASLVEDAFEQWRPVQTQLISESFEKMVTRFTVKANQIIQHIGEISRNIFDIEVEAFSKIEKLTDESDFYYMLEDDDTMFMIDPSRLSYLLPGFVFRNLIIRDLRKKIWDQLDRNCGRIRYDFVQRIDKSQRAFISQLNEKIQGLLDGVRKAVNRALEKKQISDKEVEMNVKKLNKNELILSEVLADLERLKKELSY
ncbi:dynamin family protein [Thermincola potens]|uniref:Dynamin family protein n=1 Tax=Thermincola potens (strain JR) TaxID=635013 RepID=D5XBR3_THEPJ|nr:dynamin family protein [Thermincola potens]ADG81461.1 Dynamin family protein [Thermincola potens JR]